MKKRNYGVCIESKYHISAVLLVMDKLTMHRCLLISFGHLRDSLLWKVLANFCGTQTTKIKKITWNCNTLIF